MNYILVLLGAYLSLTSHVKESLDGNSNSNSLREALNEIVENESVDLFWDTWKLAHNKSYKAGYEPLRKIIFSNNAKTVEQFNKALASRLGFELGMNHLSDMSELEMRQINGFRSPLKSDERPYKPKSEFSRNSDTGRAFLEKLFSDNSTKVPDEVDWRKVPGRVSQVKNQGQCGSCWAFSAVGVLEGQEVARKKLLDERFRDNEELVELSEQNLVDCVTKDYGCNGGFMADALDFVKEEGGIDDEQSYPYEARTRKCRFRKEKVAFTDTGAAILPEGDEEKLKEAVAKYGPVSVAIDASSLWFQFYRKGVYVNKRCKRKEEQLDHGVLVVGYGTDPKKGDYWIVKNSWGKSWGEHGYIRMARNRGNMCGIATAATLATF